MVPRTSACFELRSGETWRAPWPMYAALRDTDPAHHVEQGDYWVLSRYADVQARFPRFTVQPAAGTFAPGHYTRRYATLPFTAQAR